MKDKKPLVLQEEYGKDEDGTQVNIANICVCVPLQDVNVYLATKL